MDERLVRVIEEEQFLRSVPADEVAHVAQRRWESYDRRHPKAPSRDERLRDLAKGLRDRYELDPSLGGGGVLREYEYLARKLAPLLEERERRGVVWIAPAVQTDIPAGMWVDPATTVFWVNWEYLPDDSDDRGVSLLATDEIVGADAAVAWGRERARVVRIRLSHGRDGCFSAGEIYRAYADDVPTSSWPPTNPPPKGWWSPPPDAET